MFEFFVFGCCVWGFGRVQDGCGLREVVKCLERVFRLPPFSFSEGSCWGAKLHVESAKFMLYNIFMLTSLPFSLK